MATLQQWIHSIEEGKGSRILAISVAIMAFGALAVFYDISCWKNFSSPEAMDAAQLARNIAQGRGYTTDYVRPLSVNLIQQHRLEHDALLNAHPDLANAPVYPFLLAGLMKVLPFQFETSFETFAGTYQPEILIGVLNQFLFFLSALLLFGIARRLFDAGVAWVATLVFVGTELFWRLSASGLPVMLLIFIFLFVARCMVRLDEISRQEQRKLVPCAALAFLAGIFLGLGCLTRYGFGWLALPTLAFVLLLPRNRGVSATMLVIAFVLVVAPWVTRNVLVCGKPFGTAGYAIYQQSMAFPEDTLERALNPNFSQFTFSDIWEKLKVNGREILLNDVSKLGGNWLGGFFLFGLFLPFRKPTVSAVRAFALLTVVLLIAVQALGRTHLSKLSPELNSESLLVVCAPLIFAFGTALFMTLLDSWQIPLPNWKTIFQGAFVVIAITPLLITLFVRSGPLVYPPYYPPLIRQVAQSTERNELTMTDMPWALAWYGERKAIGLTLNYSDDFSQLNQVKPINALYLSPITLNRPMLDDMAKPLWKKQETWPRFVFDAIGRGEVPTGFPLNKSRADLLPDHLYLADRVRWNTAPIEK